MSHRLQSQLICLPTALSTCEGLDRNTCLAGYLRQECGRHRMVRRPKAAVNKLTRSSTDRLVNDDIETRPPMLNDPKILSH